MLGGKYKLLKWDRQEKTYYPIEINIFQKGWQPKIILYIPFYERQILWLI
jgi:hypothetical protein